MITRRLEKEIVELSGYFPVIGILGSRQVGKTTLVKQLIKKLNKEVIYLDLENPEDQLLLNDPLLFYRENQNKCIVLDEIQRMPEQFPILRSVIDEHRVPCRFMILGSATPDLLRNSSESLAGRIAYLELPPFMWEEVVSDDTTFKKHWFSGGFPNAYLAPSPKLWGSWVQNFVKTYLERDLPQLGLAVDPVEMRRFWTMLGHGHGDLLNLSAFGRSMGLSNHTIRKYLNFLENAFIVRQLQPYAMNLKKRLTKSPKVYYRDSGLFHYIMGLSAYDGLMGHPKCGSSFEGYVIEQILNRVKDKLDGYFFRTQQGAECDLVLTKSEKPVLAIEIKFTSTPKLTKGNHQAFNDIGAKSNYVLTPAGRDFLMSESVRACSFNTFMRDYLPQHI